MPNTVIRVENLSKKYRIGKLRGYKTFRETIMEKITFPFHRLRSALSSTSPSTSTSASASTSSRSDEIWALKDVNFEVKQGEVVGIIGRNGAGKTTLLKILSRITAPTEGRVEIRGRVGSLLEVGTGFHPELTGRENIYLNGAILGMTKAEIKRKFDEIVDFAGTEKFLDTPIKRYSSGMYVRLAFAVAAHLEPEILLVDEVLAVGDTAFQKKCLGKMGDVAKEGRTVLFVSHNMGAINRLCQRAFWLDEGRIAFQGYTKDAVGQYLASFSRGGGTEITLNTLSADASVKLQSLAISDVGGAGKEVFGIDEDVYVHIRFQVLKPIRDLAVGVTLTTGQGEAVLSSYHADKSLLQQVNVFQKGTYKMCCIIPRFLLNEITYYLSATFQIPGRKLLIYEENAISFKIERTTLKVGHGIRPGVVKPVLDWYLESKGEELFSSE